MFVEALAIVHSVKESLVQAQKTDKVTWLLFEIKSFIVEGIKTYSYLIVEEFETLKNVHMMGTHIKSFKCLLAYDLRHDADFFLNHLSTFSFKVQSLKGEAKNK